jgi:hypothetical protein
MTGATLIGIIVASFTLRVDGYSQSFLVIAIIAFSVLLISYRLKSRSEELVSASEVSG